MTEQFAPDWVSPPGDTVMDVLEYRGMSRHSLAALLSVGTDDADDLIKGEAEISPEMARRLSQVLGCSAVFWLERESQYRAALAARAQKTQ